MEIPLNPTRPPLELCKIQLYSTGARGKVYTDTFYKLMNKNFGIEITIRNNTRQTQTIKVGGCVHDNNGKQIVKWGPFIKYIKPNNTEPYEFYVKTEQFSKMATGEYRVQFWLNDQKTPEKFFRIQNK